MSYAFDGEWSYHVRTGKRLNLVVKHGAIVMSNLSMRDVPLQMVAVFVIRNSSCVAFIGCES